jgi:DNA polymerase elongation subunit (family B)
LSNILQLFDLFLIDIETVPQVYSFTDLPEETRQLFVDKISKTMPENFDSEDVYQKKAGILAEFGKVICISTGFFYKDRGGRICLKIKSIYSDNEQSVLEQFIELVTKFMKVKPGFQFAGHNIREFDIPYLCRRMIINNMMLPTCLNIYGAKPWEIKMADTLQWWRFGDFKNYTSLNLLSKALGIPTSKSDIDGSMVQHVYYKEKNLQRIAKYCQQDVIAVARVIQRFKNLPLIEPENIIIVNDTQLN